jgi:hypothetical protein
MIDSTSKSTNRICIKMCQGQSSATQDGLACWAVQILNIFLHLQAWYCACLQYIMYPPRTGLNDNLLNSLPAGFSAGSRRRARRAWSLPASGAAQSPPPHPPARLRATAQTGGLILRYLLPHCHCTAGQCRTNPWPAVPDWPWGRTEFVDYR